MCTTFSLSTMVWVMECTLEMSSLHCKQINVILTSCRTAGLFRLLFLRVLHRIALNLALMLAFVNGEFVGVFCPTSGFSAAITGGRSSSISSISELHKQIHMTRVTKKQTLGPLSLSYPKKDGRAWPRPSFFGYDPDYRI